MKRDEFNRVEVKNDEQLHGIEFGKTIKNDFPFQRENVINKNELNNQAKDELNEDANNAVHSSHRSEQLTREQIERLDSSSTSSSTSISSNAASSSATGATAASGSTAAASSVAISAGVVVVSAFTVVAATPIIVSSATAKLLSFEASDSQLFYEIEIVDAMENENYRVVLSCPGYEESKALISGSNSGEFLDLKENTEYLFYVEEGNDIEIKRTLLSKTFTTKEGYLPISEFRSININKEINFLERTFSVQLDYIDEQAIYSDFELTLSSMVDESIFYTYQLEKTTDIQTFNLDIDNIHFDLDYALKYSFSYQENGNKILFEEDSFAFIDTSEAISEFNGGEIKEQANFLNGTIDVTLDYVDDFGIFGNEVKLYFYNLELGEENARAFTLPLSKETQTISINQIDGDNEVSLIDLEDGPFTYYFEYTKKGETLTTDKKEISFTDTSGAVSTFNDGTIDEQADFKECTFNVTIDYVDDFNILSNINLVIYNTEVGESNSRTYNLTKVLTSQTLSALGTDTENAIDLESGEFIYYFTYLRKGVSGRTEEKKVAFVDYEGRQSVFNSASLNPKADFSSSEFYVQLDFIDDYDRLSDFKLHISISDNATTSSFSRVFNLEKITTVQTISALGTDTEEALDLESGSYNYYFSYLFNGVTTNTNSNVITFSDIEDRVSTFNGITINQADFANQTFDVKLDFVDDFNRFSNFHIILIDNTNNLTAEYDLEKVTTVQTFSAASSENDDAILDLEHSSLSYELSYEEKGVEKKINDTTTFIDKNGLTSGIKSFDFARDDNKNVLFNFSNYTFDITMDFEDYFGYMFAFQIEFSRTIEEKTTSYQVDVEKEGGSQNLKLVDATGFEEFLDGNSVDYALTYLNSSDQRAIALSGSIVFSDSSVSQINDIEIGSIQYDGYSYYIPYRIDFIDEKETLNNLSLSFRGVDGAKTPLIQISETGSVIHDTKWQYCYFSYGDISPLLDNPVTLIIDNSEDVEIYSKEVNFVLETNDDPLVIYDMRLNTYTNDSMDYFTIQYFVFNGNNEGSVVSIKFINSLGVEYVFDNITIQGAGVSQNIEVNSSEYAEFISDIVNGNTFDVYVIYSSNGVDGIEVLCYQSLKFTVS